MIHTWDWLFLYLPRNEEQRKMVLENMESQQYAEIIIKEFVLKFDFDNENILCDCLETYEFKSKVIPKKVPFMVVKDFLKTNNF